MFEKRLRLASATVLVAVQLAAIALGQLGPRRYLCWAPLHEHARYRVSAWLGDQQLSAAEVDLRYGLTGMFRDPGTGEDWELNAIEHVFDRIRRHERAQPAASSAEVSVEYRLNGRETQTWTWRR